jgi:hypothetical protein
VRAFAVATLKVGATSSERRARTCRRTASAARGTTSKVSVEASRRRSRAAESRLPCPTQAPDVARVNAKVAALMGGLGALVIIDDGNGLERDAADPPEPSRDAVCFPRDVLRLFAAPTCGGPPRLGRARSRRGLTQMSTKPGQVQPSEESLAARGEDLAFPPPHYLGDGLAYSSYADVQCSP